MAKKKAPVEKKARVEKNEKKETGKPFNLEPVHAILIGIIIFMVLLFLFKPSASPEPVTSGGAKIIATVEVIPFEASYDATELELEHDFGLYETTLHRVGWYKFDDAKGSISEVFRADISVKNVGDENSEFLWEYAHLEKANEAQWNVTEAEFDGADIAPQEERSGYILFNTVPQDMKGPVVLVIGSSKGFSAVLGYTSKLPHTYEIVLE